MDQNYFEQLKEQDWETLSKRLAEEAGWLSHVEGNQVIAEGMTAEDIASEAIRKTWNEDRKWDVEKYPDIFDHLLRAAKSIIWNLRKRKELELRSEPMKEDIDEQTGDWLDQMESDDGEPLDELIDGADTARIQKGIKDALAGVPSGEKIFELLVTGKASREIAEGLDLSITDFYNINRSIKRRLKAHFEALADDKK